VKQFCVPDVNCSICELDAGLTETRYFFGPFTQMLDHGNFLPLLLSSSLTNSSLPPPPFSGAKRMLFTKCSYKATKIMLKKFSRPWSCHIFTTHLLYRLEQLIKRGILKQGVNLHHGWSSSIFHVTVTASLFFLCRTDQPTVYVVSHSLRVGLIRSKVKNDNIRCCWLK